MSTPALTSSRSDWSCGVTLHAQTSAPVVASRARTDAQ